MVEIVSIIFGILGLIATLASLWFAYITYANPMLRFKKYLRNIVNWQLTSSRFNDSFEYYRYSKHPEFTMEYRKDQGWDREEPWIKRVHRPDPNLFQYEVALKLNGVVIHTENFMAMDGWRYFVPIPRVEYAASGNEVDNSYYYDNIQAAIARVIGKFHLDKRLEDFCSHAKIKMLN